MVHYISVLFIKHTFVPIGTERKPLCPWRSSSHHIADLRYLRIYRALDDKFIMNMTANPIIPQRPHSIAENIPADRLNDVFYEFRTVAFDAFPFFSGTDAFIGYGFTAKSIFSDTRLDVAKSSTGREFDEEHPAST